MLFKLLLVSVLTAPVAATVYESEAPCEVYFSVMEGRGSKCKDYPDVVAAIEDLGYEDFSPIVPDLEVAAGPEASSRRRLGTETSICRDSFCIDNGKFCVAMGCPPRSGGRRRLRGLATQTMYSDEELMMYSDSFMEGLPSIDVSNARHCDIGTVNIVVQQFCPEPSSSPTFCMYYPVYCNYYQQSFLQSDPLDAY